MGNSLSDPEDLLIPFFGNYGSKRPKAPFSGNFDVQNDSRIINEERANVWTKWTADG
jgi:hypothetical protein